MKNIVYASLVTALVTLNVSAQDINSDSPPSQAVNVEGGDLRIVGDAVNNQFPVANNMFVSVAEDGVYYGNLNATDPDGDILSFALYSSPSNGTVDVSTDGRFTYTPSANFNGSDQFFFSIDDGFGGSDTALVTVTVSPVNDSPVANNDVAVSTSEETSVTTGDLLANDTDVEGDILSISSASATSGQVVNNGDGTVTYTPSTDFFGSDTISVTISDGNGGTDTSSVAVTVTNVNDAPVAADDATLTTSQDTAATTVNVLANDIDADGDALSLSSASATNGSVAINGVGTLTYTPAAGYVGTDTIVYTVVDGNGGSDSASVPVTVSNVNDAPVASDDAAITTPEETAITTGDLLANDTDADGDTLSISSATATSGQVVNNGDGTVTYTPSTDFFGSDTISVTISDGNGGTDTSSVAVTVTNVNDAPVAVDDAAVTTPQDTEKTISGVTANDYDPDVGVDVIEITEATALNGTVSVGASFLGLQNITYTPNAGFVGADTITYTISDLAGLTATAQVPVTVTNINDAPVATDDTAITTAEETSITTENLLANDTDADGDTLSISSATATSGQVVNNGDGTVTYTPNTDFFGSDTISVTISDGNGGTDTSNVAVTVTNVNDAPVASDDPALATSRGKSVSTANVLANDSDADNDSLAVTLASASNGSVVVNSDGTLTYTPESSFVGSDTITYTVIDGNGGSDTASISVNVANSNEPPVATDDTAITTSEETSITTENLLANDTDADGDTLSISSATATSGQVVNNGDGTVTYTPNTDFFGSDTISVTISDGNGGTDTSSVAVTVTNVNDAPVAADDAAVTTSQDTAATTVNVLTNDVDADGDVLTVTLASAPNGSVTVNSDGTLTYTPDIGFVGGDTITYTVSDGNGGNDTASIAVTVTNINDLPVANDDANVNTDEDASVTISGVLDNDTDADGDTLLILSASAVNGSVSASGGDLVYTPAANFNGTDTITYVVSDSNGGTDSAVIKVIVAAVNDAPNPVDDSGFITPFETSTTLSNLLQNDTDIDGDNLTITSASSSDGIATLANNGTITFTPASGFSGQATVIYTVSDGSLSATASVSIIVSPQNSPPTAVDDTGLVMEAGTTLTLDAILNNDSDVDGDSISIVGATASAGTVTVVDGTTLSFTVAKDTSASSAQIVYTIEDSLGQTDTATITVSIIPDNFAPIANDDDALTINQGDSVTIDVLSNDTDADGDTLTVVSAAATEGQVEVNSDGTLTYTSDGIFTGDDLVTYTIDDGRGARDSATVIVTILAVNEEPENEVPSANNDPALTTEFETPILNIDVLANDTDPDGSVLKVIQASAQYGQVQINADNTLNYTPASGFSGADVVTYTISDGEGGRDSANFTVTVAAGAANAAPRALTDGPFNIGLEETQITFNVLLNDVDPDGDPIELLNASADKGKLTALPDGTIRYTKPVDFDGSDTVRYTISDGRGGIGNGKATITGPATIENRAPVAAPDGPFTVVEGGRAKDIDVLANDTDADGDRLTVISASASSGTATVSDDNTVDYVAAPGFVGTDTITYEISDGKGGTASSTVSVSVVAAKATNSAPVASAATFKVTTDTTLVSSLPAATDAELDPVRYVLAIAAKDGIANVDGNGRFTYKPEPGFVGTDTFFFYVTDGQLNSRNYQVTLDIDGDSDGDGYLDSIDQCVNTDPGSKVDNTGCAIEEAEDFDGDGVSNENDNCPSTPAGQDVDANGCSDEQLDEAVEDFRDIEDDVQEVAEVTTVKEETKTLATTVNTGCNASISQGVSSGQQSSLGQACQTLKSGENTSEQVKDAVEEINYEEVSALSDNAIAANANQTKAVGNRMQVVNTGGGGGTVSVNGLNIRYGKQSIPTVALQEAVNAILGLAAGEGEEGDSFLDFGKLGIFIQGDLDFGDRDTQGNQTGYESDSWNLTIGGDYRFKDNLYGGLAFNFGETEVQYDTRGDESTIENWGMSFYGGWQITEAWYVDGLISYGNSDYSTLRNIEYTLNTGDFQATQRGDTTGTQLSYGINTGYMYSKNGFRFGPVLSFFYSDGTIDGFKEKAVKGSDAWAFDVGEQTIQSTRVSAGLQMDYSWLTDFGVIVPGIRAAYVREKEGSDDTITVRLANGDAFADGSSRFSIQNQKDDEGYYDISVNISGQFVMGVSGFVSYQFYQDYGGYTREGYSIGIRWDKPF